MAATLSTTIPGLPPPRHGKVREVYDLGDRLLIVATDRISAFDVVMANGIPDKGRILNQMSAFWFDRFREICPHHLLATDRAGVEAAVGAVAGRPVDAQEHDLSGRAAIAKKARPLPIECVARGYLAGSLYKEYRREGRHVHGLDLPEGLQDGSRLPSPIFTPATKAEMGHDQNLSWAQAVDLVGMETAAQVRQWTLEIYRRASDYALQKGLILADTKFEFGETDDGLIWIDEALTPDSSRFWVASEYAPGGPQQSYDKQFVRDYLESIDWDKSPPGPALPDEIVAKTRAKYLEAFELIVGRPLDRG